MLVICSTVTFGINLRVQDNDDLPSSEADDSELNQQTRFLGCHRCGLLSIPCSFPKTCRGTVIPALSKCVL